MTGWNLPPGVTESMIPGNRPEDEAFERVWQVVYDTAERYGEELVHSAVEDALRTLAEQEQER